MSIKDSAKKTRGGRVRDAIAVAVAVLVLFNAGAFMFFWFFSLSDSSGQGHALMFVIGLACWGMAVLLAYAWRHSSGEGQDNVAERVGVPDSVRHAGGGQTTTNIPNRLRGHQPPIGALVVAGQPIWFSRVMLLVVLAIGFGLLYLGWNIETIIPEWPAWVGYLFMGLGVPFVLGGLWPNNWRKRLLGFIAMPTGIYVHGQGVYPDGHERTTPQTRWLFVPWANVVDVREGLEFKGAGGQGGDSWWPSTKLTLRVTPDEARGWFPFAESEPSEDGTARIVSLDYTDSDPRPKETVPRLQRLWRRANA